MELANIAFHAETPGRYSVHRKNMRKRKLSGKVNNLCDENRGKRVLLKRYLNDAVQSMDYFALDDISDEAGLGDSENILDCAFAEPDSVITEQSITERTYGVFDTAYIYDRNCSDATVSESTRGTERKRLDAADSADDTCARNDIKSKRVVVGRGAQSSKKVRSLFAKNSFERKAVGYCQTNKIESSVFTKEVVITEVRSGKNSSHQSCACNELAITRKRLQHKAKGKLRGLLNLYKTVKLNKKASKKNVAGHLNCLAHAESSNCLNSAFIGEPTRPVFPLHLNDSALDAKHHGNKIGCSEIIGESSETFQYSLNYTRNSVETSVLNAAFINSGLMNSFNYENNGSAKTVFEVDIGVDQAAEMESFEHSLDQVEGQSKYVSMCKKALLCSPSRYDDFAYFNNGFVMD